MVAGPARGLFLVLFIATVVVWAVAELRQAVKRRPEASRSAWGNEVVLRVAAVAGALLAVAAPRAVPAANIEPRALAAWLGLAFLWCGIALRVWCFHTLGRYFTLTVRTSTDQPVIANGPYRLLRHPSYTGILRRELAVSCRTECVSGRRTGVPHQGRGTGLAARPG